MYHFSDHLTTLPKVFRYLVGITLVTTVGTFLRANLGTTVDTILGTMLCST